jgi:RNA polymerase sigma-70 factor (ECF subfamily)
MGLVATYPPLYPAAAAPAAVDLNRLALELFDAHADGVFRLAMLILGRTAPAEDVVQETFLRLLRHIAAGRPLPNARGWLYTVAAHACRDEQRRNRRWLPWLAAHDLRQSPDRPDEADEREPIVTALRRLKPRDRLLVALRADGLSYAEIAAAARLRQASVGRLVARALERLARELDSLGAPR